MSTLGESIWRVALAGSSNLILLVEVAVVHAVYEFSLLKCPCVWGGPPRILSLLPNLLAYWCFQYKNKEKILELERCLI